MTEDVPTTLKRMTEFLVREYEKETPPWQTNIFHKR